MGSEARKLATYEDLLKVPDRFLAQILAGELVTSPRPAAEHCHASSSLGAELFGPFQRGKGGPGGWWILDEPEIHLHDDIVVPDLAGWRLDLHPHIQVKKKYHEIPPQWICEVLSPGTAGYDRVIKMRIYLRENIDHVWLIHPLDQTLEAYQRHEREWVLLRSFRGEELVRIAPFEAIEIELGSLWLPDEIK